MEHRIRTISIIAQDINRYSHERFPIFSRSMEAWTVGYGVDMTELRFVDADPLAYQTLLSDNMNYPNQAVFAKIGMKTDNATAFISSKVPSEIRRFQFMVHNQQKYASTDGWDYAIFDVFESARGPIMRAKHVRNRRKISIDHMLKGIDRPGNVTYAADDFRRSKKIAKQ